MEQLNSLNNSENTNLINSFNSLASYMHMKVSPTEWSNIIRDLQALPSRESPTLIHDSHPHHYCRRSNQIQKYIDSIKDARHKYSVCATSVNLLEPTKIAQSMQGDILTNGKFYIQDVLKVTNCAKSASDSMATRLSYAKDTFLVYETALAFTRLPTVEKMQLAQAFGLNSKKAFQNYERFTERITKLIDTLGHWTIFLGKKFPIYNLRTISNIGFKKCLDMCKDNTSITCPHFSHHVFQHMEHSNIKDVVTLTFTSKPEGMELLDGELSNSPSYDVALSLEKPDFKKTFDSNYLQKTINNFTATLQKIVGTPHDFTQSQQNPFHPQNYSSQQKSDLDGVFIFNS